MNRFIHDILHLTHELMFNIKDEISVCELTKKHFTNYLLENYPNLSKETLNDCMLLVDIEIKHQVSYYVYTGNYVSNQTKFTQKLFKELV